MLHCDQQQQHQRQQQQQPQNNCGIGVAGRDSSGVTTYGWQKKKILPLPLQVTEGVTDEVINSLNSWNFR